MTVPAGPLPATPEPPPPEDEAPIVIGEEHLDLSVELERGMSAFPKLTVALIAIDVVVLALEVIRGALSSTSAAPLVALGAKERALIGQGELWRLVSPLFLHASAGHLVGNCVALYILGVGCEHAFGRLRTLNLYVGSGIVASAFSCLSERPSVGASGAIFGLMGALAAAILGNAKDLHVRDKRVGIVLVFWAAYTILTGFAEPLVDNWAHFGGFVTGAILGKATSLVILKSRSAENGPPFVASTAAAVTALGYTAIFFVPRLL